MIKTRFTTLLTGLTVAALCMGLATPAFALRDYSGTTHEELPEGVERITPNDIRMQLVRSGDGSGEAIMRLITPVALSGCPHIGPIENTVTINSNFLDITVGGYKIDRTKIPPGTKSCDPTRQYAMADIPLDRALLRDNGITEIRFATDGGADYYTVALTDHRLELLPRKQLTIKPMAANDSRTGGVAFWYYPDETLILTAPMARAGTDLHGALNGFAAANGMVALDDILQGFDAIAGKPDRAYYIDQAGRFGHVTGTDAVAIGSIPAPAGTDSVMPDKTIEVYARRPGAME